MPCPKDVDANESAWGFPHGASRVCRDHCQRGIFSHGSSMSAYGDSSVRGVVKDNVLGSERLRLC